VCVSRVKIPARARVRSEIYRVYAKMGNAFRKRFPRGLSAVRDSTYILFYARACGCARARARHGHRSRPGRYITPEQMRFAEGFRTVSVFAYARAVITVVATRARPMINYARIGHERNIAIFVRNIVVVVVVAVSEFATVKNSSERKS